MASRTAHLESDMLMWRHEFHMAPGPRFDVGPTASTVSSVLKSAGLAVVEDVGLSGVVASLKRGTSGRAIALRADMDALPIQTTSDTSYRSRIDGHHHGCGHDGHTAMLLGAAVELADSDTFDGSVHFIFQPNEEEGKGAQAMIDDGLFSRWHIDEVYGMHCAPTLETGHFAMRVGPMMTFEDNFVIELHGRGGHSSAPHMTRDPLVAAAEIVSALQSVISRSVNPLASGVVSVTEIETDGSRNVIPTNVVIRGDARGYDTATQHVIERRIRELVTGIAQAHGLEASVLYTNEFVPMLNTTAETDETVQAAISVVGQAAVDSDCDPSTGSEDFARLLIERPGSYVLIGNGSDGSHGLPWHNPGFDFNDEILTIGADYWVALVERRLRGT